MPQPDPVEWRSPEPVARRLVRALSTPVMVGGTVFVVAIIVAIVVVLMRPHGVDLDALHAVDTGLSDAADDEVFGSNESVGSLGEASLGSAAEGSAGSHGEGGDVTAARSGTVFVHVVGEVLRPGVVELAADARVEAAIDAAGGATEDAVLAGVNLARAVVDGEQIVVPDKEGASQSPAEASVSTPSVAADGGLINVNTADAAALETLPRIGPALAERILEWRATNGNFSSVEQLLDVAGIGDKTLEGFRDRVTL